MPKHEQQFVTKITSQKSYLRALEVIATNTTCIRESRKIAAKIGLTITVAVLVMSIAIGITILVGMYGGGQIIAIPIIIGLAFFIRIIWLFATMEDIINDTVYELSQGDDDDDDIDEE